MNDLLRTKPSRTIPILRSLRICSKTARPICWAILLVATLPGCKESSREESKPALNYGQLRFTSGALVQLAEAQGYFADRGLDYRCVDFPAGPDVLTSLRTKGAGGSAAGTAAITPIINVMGAKGELVILASIFASDQQAKLITFRDTKITDKPESLRGKRIGLTRNTIADVYLWRLLRQAGLTTRDVTLVYGKPPEVKSLLLRGDLDAIVIWDPFIVQAEREYKLGLADKKFADRGECLVFVEPQLYESRIFIVTTRQRLSESRDQLIRLLQAVKMAAQYTADHREEAQRKVEAWLNVEPGDLDGVFATSKYVLDLDVPEVKRLINEELKWLHDQNPDAHIPTDLDPYFDMSLLRGVDVDAVRQ